MGKGWGREGSGLCLIWIDTQCMEGCTRRKGGLSLSMLHVSNEPPASGLSKGSLSSSANAPTHSASFCTCLPTPLTLEGKSWLLTRGDKEGSPELIHSMNKGHFPKMTCT